MVATRQFNKLKSDLFKRNGFIPDGQSEIMNRNGSVSGFLRLPPEIRLRIYKLVLGSQRLWIRYERGEYSKQYTLGDWSAEPIHCGEKFVHSTFDDPMGRGLDLRLLRVSRHIFSETALLPYALNKFTFDGDDVRRKFERLTRPGKKLVQKRAIGKYEIKEWNAWMLSETEEMADRVQFED